MHRQRPVILLALIAYIVLPSLFQWVTDASSAWYKPFILWALVVVAAVAIQTRKKHHDV